MHTLAGSSQFPTTRWTLVVAAADPQRKEPLRSSSLCARATGIRYTPYLRRRGYHSRPGAGSDAGVLHARAGRAISRSRRPGKGRFRSFILTSLKFFVADEADRNRAQKRGGGAVVPLEFSSGEERYQREPAHDETPERIFETALGAFDARSGRGELRNEFVHHGRPEHFERLKVSSFSGSPTRRMPIWLEEMNTSEGALKVAHSSASQEVSRTFSPGNRRYRGRSRRSGVRTPVFGGRLTGSSRSERQISAEKAGRHRATIGGLHFDA